MLGLQPRRTDDGIIYLVSQHYKNILNLAVYVREQYEFAHGAGPNLKGKGLAASRILCEKLKEAGFNAHVIEGYCWFDTNLHMCNGKPFEKHAWIQVYGLTKLNRVLYVDITGDQFKHFLMDKLRGIHLGAIPSCMRRTQPSKKHLVSIGYKVS